MKLVVTVQIDARDARVGVLEAPQIARIPAETQVVGEVAHQARAGVPWRAWGPYLSERQWGTVREDYSDSGGTLSMASTFSRARAYATS